MQKQIRFDDEDFLQLAETRANGAYRKPSKQIQYWAEIGRKVEENLTFRDLQALANEEVEVFVRPKLSPRVELNEVRANLEAARDSGTLLESIGIGKASFEASPDHPDMVIRLQNGKRELGTFENGVFKIARPSKKSK
ncbi:MAG: hypothetical protein AB7K68_03325 [Bacteriovoracia bacterium]